MRITMIAVGSRGDVQPYVALGLGLQQAGYDVRLATHTLFREFVTGHRLAFAPIEGNPRTLVEGAAGQAWLSTGRNYVAFAFHLIRLMRSLFERLLADTWRACEGTDAIVYSTLGFPGYHVAEKLGVPHFGAYLQPLTRTRAFPSIGATAGPRLGGTYNLLTHVLSEQMFWQPLRVPLNQWRRETLGLAPVPFAGVFGRLLREQSPTLYGYSPAVVPKPPDWGPWIHVTGYWFLDRPADWRPPDELVDFLDAGPPPVYLGFGSMAAAEAERLTHIALEALERTGQRGILATGWGGLRGAGRSNQTLVIEDVAHDWLFPRTAAIVHHGGAGTTGAALRSGMPSIVVPFFADQPFWGERVADLGVGPRPIPRKRLTADQLSRAIWAALDDTDLRARATALGERIRGEHGVARAVEAIQAHLR